MNLYEAANLAKALMIAHGVGDWAFGFDHARRRFGRCDYTNRRITLSRPLVLLNGLEQVRDTILHEIAHALCPGDGHGARWKAACHRLGADPKRCYDEAAVVSPPRTAAAYRMGCPACGWWAERRRRTRRKYLCRACRGEIAFVPARVPLPPQMTEGEASLAPTEALDTE